MITQMFNDWWLLAVRGVLAIILGVLAIFWPPQALIFLVVLFGAITLMDGVLAMIMGFISTPFTERRWVIFLEGAVEIIIGSFTLLFLNTATHFIYYAIAAWAIITGILEIVAAIHLWRVLREPVLILSALFSIIIGIMPFVFPGVGEIVLVWMIGICAFVRGILLIVDAFCMHDLWLDFEGADPMIEMPINRKVYRTGFWREES
jgi:uncharacterized membrane protein HdeD (DUF308 family)